MRKIVLGLFLALALAGCGDRAKELYETAQFEEQQFNVDHASELYRQIVAEHPDSPFAPRARQRLQELQEQ